MNKKAIAFTIRVFSVVSRTLFAGVLPLFRNAIGVFCSPSRLDHCFLGKNPQCMYVYMYICVYVSMCVLCRWNSSIFSRSACYQYSSFRTFIFEIGRVFPSWKISATWSSYSSSNLVKTERSKYLCMCKCLDDWKAHVSRDRKCSNKQHIGW